MSADETPEKSGPVPEDENLEADASISEEVASLDEDQSLAQPSRLAAYLCPPWGIVQLWRMPGDALGKAIGTGGLLAFMVLYAGVVVFVLKQAGVVSVEWRGAGYPSIIWTWNRASANYRELEAHREAQAAQTQDGLRFKTGAPWPGFRGAKRDGISRETIRLDWDQAQPKKLWLQPSGEGHSSFAVANGRAFTQEQRRGKEAVVAYHLETGRELWKHEYRAEFNDEWKMGDIGPRATPVWDNGRVFALGAEGHLFCLAEKTGEVDWEKHVFKLADSGNLPFGMAASPLVVGDLLIVPAGSSRHSLLALDKTNGSVVWKSPVGMGAYTSPSVAVLNGVKQILITGAEGIKGISLEGGKVLWGFPWDVSHNNNIAQPIAIDDHRVFISAGYGKGCAMLDLKNEGGQWSVGELWRNRFMKNKFSSSVYLDGFIYGLDDTILACLDAETGQRKWKGERYGYGQLLMVGEHLVIVSGTEGDLALVKASPEEPVEIARFAALGTRTWNHPVIADGRLLIRNAKSMACYDVSSSPSAVQP
ncbi:MAG: hypothetical protein CMO74_03030 [Verrucomicrobiales bacterium]|nr:hypothetical protein [Verrucomicrobiales bacterium]|tara:strand:- start:2554 stop:4155 length:1602 start_codon:yes stop_codon:yes gene_type:complete